NNCTCARSKPESVPISTSNRLLTGRHRKSRAEPKPRFHTRGQVVSNHEIKPSSILMPKAIRVLLVVTQFESDRPKGGTRLRETIAVAHVVNERVNVVCGARHQDASASGVRSHHQPAD